MAGSGRAWYYKRGEKKYGPLTTVQLQKAAHNGMLLPTDLMWREGMKVWAPASKLKGLTFGSSGSQPSPRQVESEFPSLGDLLFTAPPKPQAQPHAKAAEDMLGMLPPPDPALLALKAAREKPAVKDTPKPPPRRMYTQHLEDMAASRIVKPAGAIRRLLAMILDCMVVFVCVCVFILLPMFILLMIVDPSNIDESAPAKAIIVIANILTAVFQFGYFMFADTSEAQASPGKRMMGIMVTDRQGQPMSNSRVAFRGFLKLICMALMWLPMLTIIIPPRKQAIYDMLVGSAVVRR